MSPLMKKMLEGKKARRKELAALSFEEKLELVEKMRDRSLLLASNPLRRKAVQNSSRTSAKKDD